MSNFIEELLHAKYQDKNLAKEIYESPLIQYIKRKTMSASGSSKSRGSFGNLYAIYVLVEDYITNNFHTGKRNYSKYRGTHFTTLFNRQRELPFGSKLQNHPLNHRCNQEFIKYFPNTKEPIIRNTQTKMYWFNEDLLIINGINIAEDIIIIIDKYVNLRLEGFTTFFEKCLMYSEHFNDREKESALFIKEQLNPNVDARIFEIVSYCILKYAYIKNTVHYGETADTVRELPLVLYKTGRTNANDGGIDFIMKPLGRIFQVTEELNFKKYFLDIDKLIHYPITFVVKTNLSPSEVFKRIKQKATEEYSEETLREYLTCFEEIITINVLERYLDEIIKNNLLVEILNELVHQCRIEYNIEENEL